METLISLAIVGAMVAAAVFFARWYLANSKAKRDEIEQAAASEAARDRLYQSGHGSAEPPPVWNGEDLAHAILNDGVASNAQHVDGTFKREYWKWAESAGMAVAFRKAMYKACWRSGSQGQVYDRLKSHDLISEHERDTWKWLAEQDFPSGYGRILSAGCSKVPREI